MIVWTIAPLVSKVYGLLKTFWDQKPYFLGFFEVAIELFRSILASNCSLEMPLFHMLQLESLIIAYKFVILTRIWAPEEGQLGHLSKKIALCTL